MNENNKDYSYQWRFAISILLVALTLALGFGIERTNFGGLIGLYTSFFCLYIFIFLKSRHQQTIHYYTYLGIILRLMLVFSLPNLSDDVYRFIWDGRLINNGLNPFDHLPSYYISEYTGIAIPNITSNLYQQLNSPNYFTIYPPICQGIFAFATWLFPSQIWASAVVMKLFLFAAELGTLLLLQKDKTIAPNAILLYALNPLIIIEVCGNLHFEGAMVFFLLLAYYALIKNKIHLSAIAFALSIASKLLPLMFLPFLIRRLGWKQSFYYFSIIGVVLILLFLPMLNGVFLANFSDSLDLYFRRFEFNASLYYLVRGLGYKVVGYNMIGLIGPLLALSVFIGINWKAWKNKRTNLRSLPEQWLFAICLYLLCTTTIHPWYTSLPIVLCLFTRFRFPIAWSALIFLTYINYSYQPYIENLWVVGIEYGLVSGFFVLEFAYYPNKQIVKKPLL